MSADSAKTCGYLTIHEFEALLSNTDHTEATNEIVAALGGIDKILREYLRISREYEGEELLSESEMHSISEIINRLNTKPVSSFWNRIYFRAKLKNNAFRLYHSDTLLHCIFPHHPEVIKQFMNILKL